MRAALHCSPLRGCTAALVLAVLAHGGVGWVVLRGAATSEAMPAGHTAATAMLLVAPQSSTRPVVRTEAPRRDTASESQPVEREAAPASKAAPLAAAAEVFKSPGELERAALPRSAPDISMLAGLPWSGLPTRLRLFVDAGGTVVDVAVLQTSEDEEVVERVRRMFLSTAFVAGRAEGIDVASYKDVELTLGPR
jgi:hypothetical protein